MSAQVLPVIQKRLITFDTLSTSSQQELIIADRVDLLHWRELDLTLRVHSHTLTGSNQIFINVVPQSVTLEDPDVSWLGVSGTWFVIASSTPSPSFSIAGLRTTGFDQDGPIAALARITATGLRNNSGAMQANLSLEFSTKDA